MRNARSQRNRNAEDPASRARPRPVAQDSELALIDRYWRAANYLSVGQIYLLDNPLLREPLRPEHVKPRLLGHWGTTPGLNFIYVHLNRVIRARDLDVIYICGPGHGGPGMVANTYLEGTYSEIYPDISEDVEGLRKLMRQFSFPGGIPSHAAPETPGSIHEGGELGYALVHAHGAAFDNPGLIVACVIGDGEAETGPLAASWHSNSFLNPRHDGAVLPILHLNGYKIANPTILGRRSDEEIGHLFRGYGYEPFFVEGSDPATMHRLMADTLDRIFRPHRRDPGAGPRERPTKRHARPGRCWCCEAPRAGRGRERSTARRSRASGALIKFRSPMFGGQEDHLKLLEDWMRGYRAAGALRRGRPLDARTRRSLPLGNRRMGANPHANGGLLKRSSSYPTTVTTPSP